MQPLGLLLPALQNDLNVGMNTFKCPASYKGNQSAWKEAVQFFQQSNRKASTSGDYLNYVASFSDKWSPADRAWKLHMGYSSCFWYCRVTTHCRKSKKIMRFFQLQKKYSYPDTWEHWGVTNGCRDCTRIHQFPQSNGQHKRH